MERSKLVDLGLTEEQVNGAMKLFNADIDPLQSKVQSLTSENETLTGQVSDRDQEIEKLGKQSDNSQKLNNQIIDLQDKIKANDKASADKLNEVQTDNAIQLALLGANVQDPKAVIPFLDKDSLVLKDGKLKGIDKQIETIKADHEFLFKSDTSNNDDGPSSHATPDGDRSNESPQPSISQEIADLNKSRII